MDSNNLIEKEIEQLIKNDEYKLLKPLLEYIKLMFINNYSSIDTTRGLLDVTKQIKTDSTGNPYGFVKDIVFGYKQPQWNVETVNQTSGDFYYLTFQVLEKVLPDLEQIQTVPSISLPVMLFVMTRKEAEELSSEQVFKGYSQEFLAEFNNFKTILAERYTANWINQYHEVRQAWQPFLNSSENIEGLLKQKLEKVKNLPRMIEPEFVNPITINNNGNYRNDLKRLRNNVCLVIIDAISMRHPIIQKEFRKSLLDVFDNTIVATFDPTKDESNILQQRMIHFIEYYQDLECSKRRHWDDDGKCNVIYQSPDLGGLLIDRLEYLLKNEDNSQSSNFLDNLYNREEGH